LTWHTHTHTNIIERGVDGQYILWLVLHSYALLKKYAKNVSLSIICWYFK
jgi:hypothetical protein